MAMSVGPADGNGDEELNSTINTTPLVDVMLVMLIIFLITIPVITQTVPIKLPKDENIPTVTKPENVNLAIDKDGNIFWNLTPIPNYQVLLDRLKVEAVKVPQPEVHIRGDQRTRYEYIGRAVFTAQRAGIMKVGFITEPPPRGG